MRLKIIAAAAVAALATLAFPTPAQASHSWGGYHWARTANPFTVELDDNVTSAWDSYLTTASSDWNTSSVLNTTIMSGSFGNQRQCAPNTGHIEICNYSYGNNGWLGLASIWVTGGVHITKAYTKVNDFYFNQAQYNTPQWRRLVMCQEIGHGFGLDHQDENFDNPNLGTCMDYTSNPSGPPSNEHPNSHDYTQLESIYAHTDSINTTGLPNGAAPGSVGESASSWGRLVSGTRATGAGSTYVRDFGHGEMIITFVIWA